MAAQGGPPTFSADGYWWWDGAAWQPAISPDRRWRWDGRAWIGIGETRPPSSGLSTGTLVAIIASTAVVVLVVVSVLAYIGFSRMSSISSTGGVITTSPESPAPSNTAPTGPIPCDQLEHTQVHYHVLLRIFNQGNAVAIPTDVGRTAACFYWLHMHAGEPGLIHVESPGDRIFTLGDFFQVWAEWGGKPQPLDSSHLSSITLTADQRLQVYVDRGDGGGPVGFPGDPKAIVLEPHEIITLEITPPIVNPVGSPFPSGF
ncbi:MAG TPA: hypothetical protein VF956_11540 [Candidatus Dormibacteraeota bacterium]